MTMDYLHGYQRIILTNHKSILKIREKYHEVYSSEGLRYVDFAGTLTDEIDINSATREFREDLTSYADHISHLMTNNRDDRHIVQDLGLGTSRQRHRIIWSGIVYLAALLKPSNQSRCLLCIVFQRRNSETNRLLTRGNQIRHSIHLIQCLKHMC